MSHFKFLASKTISSHSLLEISPQKVRNTSSGTMKYFAPSVALIFPDISVEVELISLLVSCLRLQELHLIVVMFSFFSTGLKQNKHLCAVSILTLWLSTTTSFGVIMDAGAIFLISFAFLIHESFVVESFFVSKILIVD